jgi:hypothetical protein
MTSAFFSISVKISRPRGVPRFSVTLRLFALSSMK